MPVGSPRQPPGKAMPAAKRKPCSAGALQALPGASLQDLQAAIASQLQSSTASKMMTALDMTVDEIILLLSEHKMPASTLAYTAGVMTDKIGAILNGFASIQVEYSTQADDIASRLADIARRVSGTAGHHNNMTSGAAIMDADIVEAEYEGMADTVDTTDTTGTGTMAQDSGADDTGMGYPGMAPAED